MQGKYAMTVGMLIGELSRIRGLGPVVFQHDPKELLTYGLEGLIRSLRLTGLQHTSSCAIGEQDYEAIYKRLVYIYNFHYTKLFPEDTLDRRITDSAPTNKNTIESLVRMFQRIQDWYNLIPVFVPLDGMSDTTQKAIKKVWKSDDGIIYVAVLNESVVGSVKYHLSGDGLIGGWKLNSNLVDRNVIVPHMVAKFNNLVENDNVK